MKHIQSSFIGIISTQTYLFPSQLCCIYFGPNAEDAKKNLITNMQSPFACSRVAGCLQDQDACDSPDGWKRDWTNSISWAQLRSSVGWRGGGEVSSGSCLLVMSYRLGLGTSRSSVGYGTAIDLGYASGYGFDQVSAFFRKLWTRFLNLLLGELYLTFLIQHLPVLSVDGRIFLTPENRSQITFCHERRSIEDIQHLFVY